MSKPGKTSGGKAKQKGANWTQLSFGGAMGQGQRVLRRLSQAVGQVSSTAGALVLIRILDSQAANCAEWASMSAVYVQFRVIAVRVVLIPSRGGVATNYQDCPGVAGTDRSGALAAPSSVAGVWALNNPKPFLLTNTDKKPFSYEARAIDLEDQNYVPWGRPPLTTECRSQ